jgi:hypothetical protein
MDIKFLVRHDGRRVAVAEKDRIGTNVGTSLAMIDALSTIASGVLT